MADEEVAEGEESQAVETQEDNPTIEGLLALSDADLGEVLGFPRKLQQVRQDLQVMNGLKGKAREWAEGEIQRKLAPDVSESSFRYIAEDAQYRAKKEDGKGALSDASPGSVL